MTSKFSRHLSSASVTPQKRLLTGTCKSVFISSLCFQTDDFLKTGPYVQSVNHFELAEANKSQRRLTADLFLAGRTEGFNYPSAPKEKQSRLGRRR